ncbi:MFS transporter [Xanthomonas fragariae]|nr:MFS transporter [Xanthomonas fragariae]
MTQATRLLPPSDGMDPTYRKILWRLIPFLFVCYLFNYLDRVNVGFAKLQMLGDLGMSETVYGLGAGIFFIGYLACGVPGNLILQRIGARRWVAIMMVSWGLLSTCLMFVRNPTGFYILRLLTGAAEAGFFPSIVLYLTRWFPRAQHGRVMAMFMSAIPVSGVLGGPLSGWILSHFSAGQGSLAGWQWMFLLQGLPTVLLGICVWFLLSDGVQQATWLDAQEKQALTRALADDEARKPAGTSTSLSALVGNPAVWLLGTVYFCIQSGVYAISFWLPSIIQGSGVTDPNRIGLMSAIPYLAAAVFMVRMGRSADRRWHLVIPLLVGAAGLCIAASVTDNLGLALFIQHDLGHDGCGQWLATVLAADQRFSQRRRGRRWAGADQFHRPGRRLRQPVPGGLDQGHHVQHRAGAVRAGRGNGARRRAGTAGAGAGGEPVMRPYKRVFP